MQDSHKVTVGISPMPEILNPQCSCTKCDSVSCFAKRRAAEPCACEVCRHSKSCLFYKTNINLTDSKSGSINFKELERELARENITKEIVKKEIIYELDKNNHKKIISKKQSKLSYKTVDSTDKFLMEEENNVKPGFNGVAVTNSRKEASPSTAKLTAQVMDVPYKDYQNSLSKPNFPTNLATISPFDIFNRIKEAYKACSCKVCECIVGKSLQNDLCRCKPCDCNDCASFNRHIQSFADGELGPKDDEGCPCIRCDRESCKGIGKRKTKDVFECDCMGLLKYEYLKPTNSATQACDCEPCQCMECKPKSIHRQGAIIVAPVGEDYQQRNVCQCSPCECFECGHNFGLTSNRHHEMSTSVNRHPQCHCEMCVNEACIPDGNQSCRCETQSKVMRKPFQQDSHDYDIRRATVTYDAQRRRDNYDTITMFASVPNSYAKREDIINKQCDCDQCECLVCKCKESTQPNYSSKLFEPIPNYRLRNKVNECKCSPCDCQYCAKIDSEPLNIKNVCGCDVCDCINCEGLTNYNIKVDRRTTKKLKSKFSAKGECKCDPCECTDCEKLMSTCIGDICQCSNCKCENCIKETYSDEIIYPVKRGERLTPSLFRSKIKDAFIESCISNLEANEEILKPPIAFRSSLKKPSAFRTVQKTKTRDDYNISASYQKYSQEKYSNHQILPQNFIKRTETVKHAQISKFVNGINLNCKNNEPTLKSTLSVNSSLSFIKESESITPTRSKLKSWESSCNSSGHDHPSYLIHFPKTTVETCLNDVMQFDTDNNISLTTTALSSNNNARNQHSIELNTNERNGWPMRSVFSEEKLKGNMNGETEIGNDFKYSAKIFENNAYKPHSFEAALNNVNKLQENQTNSVTRDGFPKIYEKHCASASKKSNEENIIFDEDYERVQNTLQESRAFSQHLVQLFEKYEKANREFESVSEKIKKHANIETKFKRSFDMDEEPTKEQNFKSKSGSSTEELVEILKLKMNSNENENTQLSNQRDNSLEERTDFPEDNVMFTESCDENNEGRDESGDDLITINNELLKTITEEKEPIDITHKQANKRKAINKLHNRYNKMYKRSIICSKRLCSKNFLNTSPNTDVEKEVTVTETINNPKLNNNKKLEEKRNILFEEINNFANEITGNYNTKVKLPKATEQVNLLKRVKKSTTELRVSVTEKYTKDGHTLQKDVFMIKQPIIEHSRQIVDIRSDEPSILKKNFQLSSDLCSRNRDMSFIAPLEKRVKAAATIISVQPPDENATYLYKNKALVKLHSEVKKLLDMPLLKTFEGDHKGKPEVTYNNLSKASSSQTNQGCDDCQYIQRSAYLAAMSPRNSCESMKVSFLKVRRVSDHTVLVKWNMPRVLKNVEGYELLVDGRAVQKILSPSRNMAVVTCLPHTDKVLLTVRTVVRPPCLNHYPATTVIYQPKIK